MVRRMARLAALFAAVGSLACAERKSQAPAPSAVPQAPLTQEQAAKSWASARQVFAARCIVCHGCYDAPCQLKLDTYSGIARGGSEAQVYDAARLKEAPLTRIDIDARDPATWRLKGFHPVLPEGAQEDPRKSLLLRMLALKKEHPLPAAQDLSTDFTFALDRKQTCTDALHFDSFAKDHPLWGMPYGLPGVSDSEAAVLADWVRDGAPYQDAPAASAEIAKSIETWETFLNQPDLKSRLMARYIYEHLFLASIYFKGIDDAQFYRLVRSRTGPGALADEIPTRRPFDDPGEHLYYRLVRKTGPALSKTQMVYPLDANRLKLYRELFLEPNYAVDKLPGYDPETGANPFRAFAAMPSKSRYRFMLTEAEFTIMGFIKGPVCRGQVALNVIQDRFWVLFVDPDAAWTPDETSFLDAEKSDLDMPAEEGSSSISAVWHHYDKEHDRYMAKRREFLSAHTANGHGLDVKSIWDGDGNNANAALTVFRHFDTATVVQGLVGGAPKTAWVISYPELERIHYLLVAGFDVFGNVGHQISTRVYMDFLRIESEANFLMLLPPERRAALVANWYRGVNGEGKTRLDTQLLGINGPPRIAYKTKTPELELYELLQARVKTVVAHRYDLPEREAALTKLGEVSGVAASLMPEDAFLSVRDGEQRSYFSILRESAHTNVAHLFSESARRVPEEDRLTVTPGFLGAYPNAIFEVERKDLEGFVAAVHALDNKEAYRALRVRYGVLRNSEAFWPASDRLNAANQKLAPLDSGLFDYNHLEPL
jgi:hypothetical protein